MDTAVGRYAKAKHRDDSEEVVNLESQNSLSAFKNKHMGILANPNFMASRSTFYAKLNVHELQEMSGNNSINFLRNNPATEFHVFKN